MPITKICKTCGVEKPVSLFYREGRLNARGERPPTGSCKACLDLYKQRRWANGVGARDARKAAMAAEAIRTAALPRRCRSCGVEKPNTDFYAKGLLKSGATRYRPDCIACTITAVAAGPERERIRAATAAWRAADPERGRKSSRESWHRHGDDRRATQSADRKDPIKRPKILDSAHRSVAKHKEQRRADSRAYGQAHREERAVYLSDYWKTNKDMASKCRATRRARKAGAEGSHTRADVRAIRARQQGSMR
jgi:hypothetical protein